MRPSVEPASPKLKREKRLVGKSVGRASFQLSELVTNRMKAQPVRRKEKEGNLISPGHISFLGRERVVA